MPRNGSGTYTLPAGNPVITGTTISSTVQNNTMSDVATALTNSIAKDGQTTPTANLPMGTYRHTGVGNGVAATDYTALGQAQSSAYTLIGSISGTDTITGSLTPVLTAYAAGQKFSFVSAGANTGAVTININSLGAKNITKFGATALAAGDIPSGTVVHIEYDGTQFQLVNLIAQSVASGAVGTTQALYDNSTKFATTAYADRAAREVITGLSASVGSSALTISCAAITLDFRSATLGTGTTTTVSGTPANLVISSGSTLGTTSGVQSEIAVVVMNNSGTLELAAINIAGGVDISETGLISTTAEGGAGGADSATVFYSTTARSNLAYRVLGIIRSTQATAGTWATSPSLIQGMGGTVNPLPPLTLGTLAATTSGTSVDITGILPSVKRVTLQFNGVSTNGTSIVLVQLGSGSVTATGYLGTSSSFGAAGLATTNYTAGFGIGSTGQTGAATVRHGAMVFTHMGSNVWTCAGNIGESNSTSGAFTAGSITLSGSLDRIRLTTVNGTDTFDAGSVNILYE